MLIVLDLPRWPAWEVASLLLRMKLQEDPFLGYQPSVRHLLNQLEQRLSQALCPAASASSCLLGPHLLLA
jgi:hypothetical protein